MDPMASHMPSSVEPGQHGSDTTTRVPTAAGDGWVRIRVQPEYLPQRSDPSQPMHVFAYRVLVEYDGPADAPAIQLTDRAWRIIDAHGVEEIVQGEGLVGQQPVLRPGGHFEYASYCPLRSSWGTMEGRYGLVILDDAGEPAGRHEVEVDRFYLVAGEG
ncbi:MAG: ApaG domain [Phycisphaerales bacterium]